MNSAQTTDGPYNKFNNIQSEKRKREVVHMSYLKNKYAKTAIAVQSGTANLFPKRHTLVKLQQFPKTVQSDNLKTLVK